MSTFSVTMPSGESWTPTFVQSINEAKVHRLRALLSASAHGACWNWWA
jgi:hypothetical protein